ncbi:hypothetical protein FNF27_02609 [Cafeteria roenbergensis]|uniref:2-oxoglutarate dehydrogenase, mitochondrial n=1 Tax=Cafeteria roenbergensis TaxID=33653 RepID=A0A5A8CC21_CAFRO|nr:hypothetical protein FNF29_05211 [Cafeteria roenbergensis]KAA0175888.1 hypothetical protein FNF27_02609 [Cafeteria roenbergensis]|mmetsp:Transcript_15149/g.57120  ORF Transcript_15149/g.57120 Transcript_15149/m.57120 type:complete len:1017 (+) Transcript_15149:51-3101(+)|eukprot:KAA0150636.1 hypothetical protein FNF29_05211 [Cafeteria roenbergensis]
MLARAARTAGSASARLTGAARRRIATTVAAAKPPTHPSEAFLSGTNAVYFEEMWRLWKEDPSQVHKSWATYFSNVDAGMPPGMAFQAPPSIQAPSKVPILTGAHAPPSSVGGGDPRVLHMVRAFQVRGHEAANLDPLGFTKPSERAAMELDPASYGLKDADLDKPVNAAGFEGLKGFLGPDAGKATVRELIERLRRVYCGSTGFEYMHILDRSKCNWIRERVELDSAFEFSPEAKEQIFDRLVHADTLETFLAKKFNTAKRFGLEGCETLIPGLKSLIDRGTELGVTDIVIGMPHRGRLNTLVNVVRKPAKALFREFTESHVALKDTLPKSGDRYVAWTGSGDVKYHLGTSFTRTYPDGRKINLSLVANPSHLEAVNPVVCGKVRAKQDLNKAATGADASSTLGLLMHGDAAFAGQGVVYETMMLSQLGHYGTGGTVHVIVNNQVGFTTDPTDGRSTLYSSDLGKAFDVPIFHVNANDPEAVTRVFNIALEYRMEFKEDVIIDLIGYRKYGHNEIDQPMFTQPIKYTKIASMPSARELYHKQLVEEGSLTEERATELEKSAWDTFNTAYESKAEPSDDKEAGIEWLSSRWSGFFGPSQHSAVRDTGVPLEELKEVGRRLVDVPEDFQLHSLLDRIMKAKRSAIEAGEGIDWGTAEALAFGTLAREGNRVRLSGQDCQRGTFSHRHSVLHDQRDNSLHMPLAHMGEDAAPVTIANSNLSEFAVMGFELGYNIESPKQLNLWEAQFGDFSNGAQVIIDQFLSSGEAKWYRMCGLTLLLPHGYDGQGPEHSSCRIERFLQMCDEPEDVVPNMEEFARNQVQATNWQVVNASTPANYFHVLRRQLHRQFRKPLIIPSPKYLLRHREAVSSFAEMSEGTKFIRAYPDDGVMVKDPEKVRRVVFCTGKVYYDLIQARRDKEVDDVAIVRIEQLAPFPFDKVAEAIKLYPNAADVVWTQEEPRNMGYWAHVAPRIETATKHFNGAAVRPRYVGRHSSASPAAGFGRVHKQEQEAIMDATLDRE